MSGHKVQSACHSTIDKDGKKVDEIWTANRAITRPLSAAPGGPEGQAQAGNAEQEKQIYGRQILGEHDIQVGYYALSQHLVTFCILNIKSEPHEGCRKGTGTKFCAGADCV